MSTRQPVLPEKIGRFPVLGSIGAGSQGVVLLAEDPELERKVAVKVLRPSAITTDAEQLLAEAKVVSRLQHPNVVTLHDVGRHRGLPYLVFEYVEGQSVADRLGPNRPLTYAQSVILMSQLLSGVAAAHESGIVHRDLSPSNILITSGEVPKVTGFGLSAHNRPGSLRYVSPERLDGKADDASVDVFALGAIFYEMLLGRPAPEGDGTDDLAAQILKGQFQPPSARRPEIAPEVDEVVLTALRPSPAERYGDARAMKAALDAYRLPASARASDNAEEAEASARFLLRRIRYAKGFSTLSQHLGQVQSLTSEHSKASARQLSNVIAKDVLLTQRILTTANSGLYGRGDISSVSRAVVVLGLQQVRMCISSTLLASHFGANSPALNDALVGSFLTGILAREMASRRRFPESERFFVAGMFHDLGRTLVIHYFAEEYAAIRELSERERLDELTCSRRVLGTAYHELGMRVAQRWHFPDAITAAMRPMPRGKLPPARSESDRFRYLAGLASALTRIHAEMEPEDIEAARAELLERADAVFTIDPASLDQLVWKASNLAEKYAALMRSAEEPPILGQLRRWRQLKAPDPTDQRDAG